MGRGAEGSGVDGCWERGGEGGEEKRGFSAYELVRMGRQLRGCSTNGRNQIMSVYGKFVCNVRQCIKC